MNCVFELEYSAGGVNRVIRDAAENGDILLEISEADGRRTVNITAKRPVTLLSYTEKSHGFFTSAGNSGKKDRYFMNGYQSWTDSGEHYKNEPEHSLNRLPRRLIDVYGFDRYGDYTFYNYRRGVLHGYDMFYCDGANRGFIASLNAKCAYLIIEVARKTGAVTLKSDVAGKALSTGESFCVCDYIYRPDPGSGLAAFREHYEKKDIKKIFGYTSWYNYYQNINEEILLRDLSALDDRFDLFQIDDGFETYVGDWLSVDEKKFPRSLSPIVEAAHKKGLMAGIWLAPFVAETKSRLFNEKPDWFKRDGNGVFVSCGGNWSGFYALDLENAEAREYIKNCLKTYADMGFDFFKLDFLYAASLPEYKGKTRSEAAEYGYSLLREALPGKIILGCGATLMNAAGKFDYLRIGPDVSLDFDDKPYMRLMHRERVSTKTTLKNTVYRSFTDGCLFGNDPDVFLLRDNNISLAREQKRALITINALFGSVMMTSDNVGEYDGDKKETLAAALDLFYNATVKEYVRNGKIIDITYTLRENEHTLKYHTGKGVLL